MIVYIKKSKNGRGLFAKRNIQKSEVTSLIKGSLITCNEDDDLDEQTRSNTIRFNNEKFLNPKGEIGELINHSCSPNSKIVKASNKMYVRAIENISKDTEIVFDYSTVLANDDIWQMKCNCGEKGCRKVIKMFKTLPSKTKQHYIKNKIVPKYILHIK
jgi:SET domain-containing protein